MGAATDRKRWGRALSVAALLLGVLIAPASGLAASSRASAEASGIGVKLVNAPTSSATNPLARSYIAGTFPAGAQLTANVEVSNTTARPQTISIYAAGARVRAGVFSFAAGRAENELSRWTDVSRSRLQLPPGAATIVKVHVRIPANASRGERYSVVWASVNALGALGVRLVNRVGIRMYLSVGGAAAPEYMISTPRASRTQNGAPRVSAIVKNTGPSTITVSGSMTLSHGPGGLRLGPFHLGLARPLAPGASRRIAVQLTSQLPRGPWRVVVALTSGATSHRATTTMTFPARDSQLATTRR
jgi:hypothetical protein